MKNEKEDTAHRSALACSLALFCLTFGTLGQAAQGAPQPEAIDSVYRKLDALLSHSRARNAEQLAIKSAKGIDEGRFITLGGIE